MVRSPASVFGLPYIGSQPSWVICQCTPAVPAGRSMSFQRSPTASPRCSPRRAISRYSANSRLADGACPRPGELRAWATAGQLAARARGLLAEPIMFLSPRTVTSHLYRSCPKLGYRHPQPDRPPIVPDGQVTITPVPSGHVPLAEKEGRPIAAPPGFGEVLRAQRHAASLTLEQLAEASGVSARTLSDMERGRSRGPQHRTVTALADALDLDEADREQLVELARQGRLRDHWTRPTELCDLPRSVDDFTGRAAELAWTDDLVRHGNVPGAAGAGLITGSAGLGKTALAVRVAHTLRPHFPDGVFFLDLFGMSPHPLPVMEALALLLRARRHRAEVSRRSRRTRALVPVAVVSGVSWSCSTTPPPKNRSGRCCRAVARAGSW
ncbi:helix-turn-helix domain-containing protein [Nonomuraea solani]|uniref:helix-turn-helix domain-containing protein n=1 Tax=Nonomuraea solani TaxID=1144553 RepID=UPI000CDE92A4|nr:helix-turn-helix transcriptional regulator [Nonomuraea solani]